MQEISRLPPIGASFGLSAEGRSQPLGTTLFRDWTRLTSDEHGEMQGAPLQGFYAANTQFLTHYGIKVNGEPVSHRFSSQLSANEWSTTGAVLNSGDSGNLKQGTLPCGSIEIRILRRIDQGWTELIYVKNNGVPSRKIKVEISFCCPIRDDQFAEEMKTNEKQPWKGLVPKAREDDDSLSFRFERDFGKRRSAPTRELEKMYGASAPQNSTRVTRSLEVRVLPKAGGPRMHVQLKPGKISRILAEATLSARGELCLELGFSPWIDETCLPAPRLTQLEPLPRESSLLPQSGLQIRTSHSLLNQVLSQAQVDLRALRLPIFGETQRDDAPLAYNAGIPRYLGLLGRDNLVIGLQSAVFGLEMHESILLRLALLQGVRRDPERGEEIGRFPHERRLNPYSEAGKINRELYYGDVSSPPLWILLLSNLYQWTGDLEVLKKHRATLLKSCDWILKRLTEGKGYIYYAPAIPGKADQNRNQAWKDSGDAIVDDQGRIQVPPLAVAEIQGYTYQALKEAQELLVILNSNDSDEKHADLLREAAGLKARFNRDFWDEERKIYALALNGQQKRVAAIASNMGHCLGTGIFDETRVSEVVASLMSEEMFSGWGIRTLASNNPGYDPFSYHRGAVWPVENALIANALGKFGYHPEAQRVMTAQLAAAGLFQHFRPPEVLSGHPRTPQNPTPGIYNFGNPFQAWSVSALAQHLQTLLGISPRADRGELYLDPHLPEWLEWVELRNLTIGKSRVDLRFWRDPAGLSHWQVLQGAGGLSVRSGAAPLFSPDKLSPSSTVPNPAASQRAVS
jgi:glycogen debranching enzyme